MYEGVWFCWDDYGLVGGSVPLWGWALRFFMLWILSISLDFLLPADMGLLATPPAPHLPSCPHEFFHDDNGLNV